jgi:anti-sigma B factor antagonist
MDVADMTPAPLSLARSTNTRGHVRLDVGGEVDISNAEILCRAIHDILDDPDTTGLDVDVQGLAFIDSTGAGVLVQAHRLAQTHDITVTVCNPTGIVLRVLEVLGVAKALTTDDGSGR